MFRFFFGLLYRDRIALGDPHPGNYLLRPDGRVCFLDFGLLRDIDAGHLAAEARSRSPRATGTPTAMKAALVAAGYLPDGRADSVDAELALRLMRHAIKWYAVPGVPALLRSERAPRPRPRSGAARARAARADPNQVNQFTIPPESILIRRMHAMVVVVLQSLRAGADWGAIAAEYLHGDAPATPLGEAEAEFRRGR